MAIAINQPFCHIILANADGVMNKKKLPNQKTSAIHPTRRKNNDKFRFNFINFNCNDRSVLWL